jgi:hypothetical protein
MTTSPHWAPTAPSPTDDHLDVDLLVDEPTPSGSSALTVDGSVHSSTPPTERVDDSDDAAATTEYGTAEGTPGRGIIVSTALASAALAVLDLALVGRLSLFFDLSFVVVCLVAAMAVRPRDFFTAAVLPPLAFAGTIAGVALLWPDTIASGVGYISTFLTGLATHALGLVFGYGVALLTVGARFYGHGRT